MNEFQHQNPNSLKNKTLDDFSSHKLTTSGFRGACRICINQQNRERPQTEEIRNRKLLGMKAYSEAHPERKEIKNAKRRERLNKFPELRAKENARKKKWRDDPKNQPYMKNYYKEHYRTHYAMYSAAYQRRRALINNAEGTHTAKDIRLLIKSSKGLCWWCGKKIEGTPHIDHRIPLVKGGSDWPSNLCLSCADCNRRKHTKLPHEFNGRLL